MLSHVRYLVLQPRHHYIRERLRRQHLLRVFKIAWKLTLEQNDLEQVQQLHLHRVISFADGLHESFEDGVDDGVSGVDRDGFFFRGFELEFEVLTSGGVDGVVFFLELFDQVDFEPADNEFDANMGDDHVVVDVLVAEFEVGAYSFKFVSDWCGRGFVDDIGNKLILNIE